MAKLLYRFRRIQNLLGRNELQNQEIYFAAPNELNDPMEGFKDIFWKGDRIIWKNFLKHYLLCLEHCCLLNFIGGKEHPVTSQDIPLFKSTKTFNTPKFEKIFDDAWSNFFHNSRIDELTQKLAEREKPIRFNELMFHLKIIHPIAINSIFKAYESNGFIQPSRIADYLPKAPSNCNLIDLIHSVEDEHTGIEDVAEKIYSTFYHANSQMELIARYNQNIPEEESSQLFLYYEFPEAYTKKLDNLIFAEWYVACFMEECSNSSIWGSYGDNHKGVCLIFNTGAENGYRYLDLQGINSWGSNGPGYGLIRHQFYPVNYQNIAPTIDFFDSFGRVNGFQRNEWFTDDDGKESSCGKFEPSDLDEWRRRYWDRFYSGITWKSMDWEYEKESRLILAGIFNDYSKKEDRKLKYSFSDLHGIIFGINTSMKDKLEIFKIIEEKCKSERRADFKFYQAFYSPDDGSIKHGELSLLQFEGLNG